MSDLPCPVLQLFSSENSAEVGAALKMLETVSTQLQLTGMSRLNRETLKLLKQVTC